LSRLGRRSPLAQRLPTPSPRSARPPRRTWLARRLEAVLSRAPLTVEDTLFPLALRPIFRSTGARGDLAPRRPSSCRSRVALLASSSGTPLEMFSALARPGFRLRQRSRARFELFALGLARPPSTLLEAGARQARSPHLTVARTRRSHGYVSQLSSAHWDRRTAVTPVVIDQCQLPTILFSRRAPCVPAHSASCSRTSRWLTLHGVRASLGVRGCMFHGCMFLTRSVSARTENASSPAGSPAERDSRVHRRRPRPSHTRCGSSGLPPDGLDLRPRAA
jgi:hypothetical protein